MIYNFFRPIVRFTLKLYFKNIYLGGLENLPKDKPVIFVSNHPTAFIEPCLLACFLPVQLHFLVRGDLFSKSWLSWLLKGTNQIPIFRHKDGMENVRKNLITQDHLYGIFKANKALLMFPEAHTHENIFLRKLKKGLARFAFMDHETDLHIIPIGINFDKNVLFNSKASVKIGEPLKISNYGLEKYKNEAERFRSLLSDVSNSLKSCIRHIDNEDREDELHKAFSIMDSGRRTMVFPILKKHIEPLEEEIDLASRIDSSEKYFEDLKNRVNQNEVKRMKKPKALDLIVMLMFFPIYLVSLIVHSPSISISKLIINKKVSVHEFISPVFISIMIFFNLFILIISLLLIPIFKFKVFIYLALYVIIGVLGVYYMKFFQDKWTYIFTSKESREYIVSSHDLTLSN